MSEYIIQTNNLTKQVWRAKECFCNELACEKRKNLWTVGT